MAQFTYLQGLTFSFTNVEILPLRDELERKILKLGGKYLKDFSTTLTSHLITTAPNGAKYLKAMEIKIPCLLPTFIDECWMKAHLSHHSSMNGDLPNLIKRHLIPPFYRLRITLTGFTSQERKDLSLGIIGAGGTYSPELRIETTHLIMQDNPMPSRRRPKLEYAKKWNIPIIKVSYWLMESIRKGFCLGIDDSFLYCPSSLIMVDMNDDLLILKKEEDGDGEEEEEEDNIDLAQNLLYPKVIEIFLENRYGDQLSKLCVREPRLFADTIKVASLVETEIIDCLHL